ncbi:MAG: hypothetical protein A3D31_05570 [Candidatus Fluviicola riflensis]|nr:MAG: hypothetical protein CHH17_09445 [Candidatus Fluviicola riflensis]OGS79438.1 MAG: hypothetical protein A3D31_05570 [Candidatus Fluviicola riflensis]OGS86870.1 MAG: hypothetical protein A2724_05030 [Fluviicola sp. RIFCSPHIGHO2_01_FULL_43_53]OGS89660.1 MAG: hypothetical protein A3E30_01775 [Fluviicola sp. RIFCSPHIGHO2_12_FULL_43_24]
MLFRFFLCSFAEACAIAKAIGDTRSAKALFLLVSLATFQANAQLFGNVNRNNWVKITDLQVETQEWGTRDPGVRVRMFYGKEHDSVVVYQNGVMSGNFLTHNDRITSPRLVLRDEKGNIQSIDSFWVSVTQPRDLYYGSFATTLSMHREYYPDGIPSRVCYKKITGPDSLVIEWSPEGIIRRKLLNETEYFYTPDGILSVKCSGNDSVLYKNGIVASVVNDTMVLNQLVTQVRNYSAKGTLLKESWFKEGKPVAVWREYNAEGVLVKTTKHPALLKVPISNEVAEMPYDEIIAYVTESPEYPGGNYQFEKYIIPELQSVFSSGDVPFEGKYRIHFEITEEGKPVYLSVQGENAANVDQVLKAVFEKMPKWKSGRRSGIRVQSGVVLMVDVVER